MQRKPMRTSTPTRPWPFLAAILLAAAALHAEPPVPLPDDPACTAQDRVFMRQAYELAAKAVKEGNAPFGALLVVDGKVVAEYTNQVAATHDPTRHAELGLISAYAPKLPHEDFRRGTLYASSEPCIMCSGAILHAGVMRIVYGTTEAQFQKFIHPDGSQKPLTCREIMARTYPAVQVLGPLMEQEGLALHAVYWPEAMKTWKNRTDAR